MLTQAFLVRLLEQMVVSFLLSFGAAATATDGGFTKAAVLGGVAAGVRAVYGVFATTVGDSDQPQKF